MSVMPVGISHLPSPVFKYMFTYLDPQALAVSSRVCKLWQNAAKPELICYRMGELLLRYEIYHHLTVTTGQTEEEEAFIEQFEKDFFSDLPDISKQIFPSTPKNNSSNNTSSISEIFKKILNVQEQNYYMKFEKLMNDKLNENPNEFFIFSLPPGLFESRFFVHASNQFNLKKFNFVYINSLYFKDHLRTKISDSESIFISRGVCEDFTAFSCIKEVLGSSQKTKNFTFLSENEQFNASISPFEQLYKEFNKLNHDYNIVTNSFHVTDLDAFWISKLIKTSNKLTICFFKEEVDLTNRGLKDLAEALKVRNHLLIFQFHFKKREEISDGIQMLRSLIGTIPFVTIVLKEI